MSAGQHDDAAGAGPGGTVPEGAVPGGAAPRGADVTLEHFGWYYPGRQRPSLSDVSARITPGERVLLLGPSGAGKSTLLQALAGVEQDPDGESRSGELAVDGADPRESRGAVGFMHQDPETQVVLSRIGDDVAFGLENLAVPPEQIWPRVDKALERVGLRLPLAHPTTALSGGQKQRLALAGVMAMRPRLLLLDEPTASVDHEGAEELCRAVSQVVREDGITLVVVEHRVALWEGVVDRVIVLDEQGRVAFDGPTRRTLAEARSVLQEQGTWVPDWVPSTRVPAALETPEAPGGDVVLSARDLAVSRVQPPRRAIARQRRRARRAWRRGEAHEGGFPGFEPPVAAEGITVDVRAGRALAVTGPNGAGKSTLALTLAGLLVPLRGTVRAADALAAGAPPDPALWDGDELISRVGTVFQHPEHQFLRSTVREELEFGPEQLRLRTGRSGDPAGPGRTAEDDAARVDDLLRRLRLEDLADANPFTLSGGQKRRLSVATVLAAAPGVVILDEPTFGQDSRTWKELVDLLVEELDRGTAVVAVTHDRELMAALGAEELRMGA
ncbi:ABC transporter ATP-binding protein [Kocuria varians]|uniref:ABC transporter ATP-binding protein n=1 Tax=Kocuria varians TaxID=1272 RepID=A0A4Y4D4W5_KOCVA|nr:ATP-binding cassette domain-containing protein [Kocuria varians]GED00236.1 ABC transporter ATP-binding protein [Kocuria varians]